MVQVVGKVSKRTGMIEALFGMYIEGNGEMGGALDTEKDQVFHEYYEAIDKGEADPEGLSNVQYTAARAAFYAGFETAKELLR